ncbi:MAG TPA: hypothetical protein VEO56_13405 [Bacteroidota bacterium]|nr:hypothetical protein [Bacteroidota bacterium]
MKADTLKAFFEKRIPASALSEGADGKGEGVPYNGTGVLTDDLKEDFVVETRHLIAICDAVLSGAIKPCQLEQIASILVQSERFLWDPRDPLGKRVSEVIYAWEAPEINYLLTRDTVVKFRNLLLTGERTFVQEDWWR